jgi:8-oxo-dGTP pyrophosphatase MutT (NUDIX family)
MEHTINRETETKCIKKKLVTKKMRTKEDEHIGYKLIENENYIYLDPDFYNNKYSPSKKFVWLSPTQNNENLITFKNVFCVNCGDKGHVVRECSRPITSFGIIAFKEVKCEEEEKYDKNDELNKIINTLTDGVKDIESNFPKIKFLMIQRKDTMGFIDFVRGKYPTNPSTQKEKWAKINICLNEMTYTEKQYLLTMDFDMLWNYLWVNRNSKTFKNEYEQAKKKFNALDIKELVNNSTVTYKNTEFGFPKGRRNMRETNIACAEREFREESGYDRSCYEFITNYPIIQEEFLGTNNVQYRHIYFLVKMKDNVHPPTINPNDIVQIGEVRNIGWFTLEESLQLIRPYDKDKKRVIEEVHSDIVKMNSKYNCSSYYRIQRNEDNYNNSYNTFYRRKSDQNF